MASNLLYVASHEAENQTQVSITQAFELLERKLKPPFSLSIPDQQEYSQLNRAILYGVLCQPHLAKTHIKHLHAIVTDGYGFFVKLLSVLVSELYVKLVDSVKNQLIWVVQEMIDVSAAGVDGLLIYLLRQIVGGEYSDGNLWLCFELVSLLLCKWDLLLEEQPLVLSSALYTYLRLLADHCRLSGNVKLEALKQLEIEFCVKVLREEFHLCLKIGRDLIRLLQDLVHVPVFRDIWKDLVYNPSELRTPGFSDISQIYHSRTSSRYFLLRITTEMETQIRFLLTHVKLGNQKRYQTWFARKFLSGVDRETLVIDIVRFICCAHHPPNEIIQSDVIPRWAVIGWLLTCCRKNYIEAKVKLALLYDWLFFDEKVDNIMNIEPAMLLMVHSIPKYADMTRKILEFLFLLVENYDVERRDVIVRGVSSALSILVSKGVVRSLDVLTSCGLLSPYLKERLQMFLAGVKTKGFKGFELAHLSGTSLPPLSLPYLSHITPSPTPKPPLLPSPTPTPPLLPSPTPTPPLLPSPTPPLLPSPTPTPPLLQSPSCPKGDGLLTLNVDTSVLVSSNSSTSLNPSVVDGKGQLNALENLVQNLGEKIKMSNITGLLSLEEILLLFMTSDNHGQASSLIPPENLSRKLTDAFELNGCKLFSPLNLFQGDLGCEDAIRSATTLIIRAFFSCQHQRMQELLVFWSRNGFPVGACLLSYASRLAFEANLAGHLGNAAVDNIFAKISDSKMPLSIFHADGYCSFLNRKGEDSPGNMVYTSEVHSKLVTDMVERAFAAYRCFLTHKASNLHEESCTSLLELLLSDLISCSKWERKGLKFLFCSVFCHLSDLSLCKVDIIKLLVGCLDHADLVGIQCQIGLKKFCIFGKNTEAILNLITQSLNWGCLEQHKLWDLIRSEFVVSQVQMEKIILEFFCSGELDENVNAIAVGGLLTLCSCQAPTAELVGAIMLLPNNAFRDFAAAILSAWVMFDAPKLFDSLAIFSEKLDNKNGNSCSAGITVNHSAILWLLKYFNEQGMEGSKILSNFSVNIPGIENMQQT